MTDETATPAETPTHSEAYNELVRTLQPDGFLATLVENANNATESLPIGLTLTIGGTIVTGSLIGRLQWLDEMKQQLNAAEGTFLDEFRDQWAPLVTEAADESNEQPWVESIIHLSDTRIWLGNEPAPGAAVDGLLWRGRLSEVQGWTWGIVSRAQPS